jgi:hypothetical protein
VLIARLRAFTRVFVDNVVVVSKTLTKHIKYLRQVFICFIEANITLKGLKYFIVFPLATILRQKVDTFSLLTTKERLAAIVKLTFLETLQ